MIAYQRCAKDLIRFAIIKDYWLAMMDRFELAMMEKELASVLELQRVPEIFFLASPLDESYFKAMRFYESNESDVIDLFKTDLEADSSAKVLSKRSKHFWRDLIPKNHLLDSYPDTPLSSYVRSTKERWLQSDVLELLEFKKWR